MTTTSPLFQQAQWIWSGSETGHDDYRQARHSFTLSATQLAARRGGARLALHITADAYYQVALNDRMLGQGPAKSAKGTRGVDVYDLATVAAEGENRLAITVLNVGVGTMSYCWAPPGLRFEVRLDDAVLAASGTATRMRPDPTRTHQTVRRWILPCIEDVDAAADHEEAGDDTAGWTAATVVQRDLALYARRVPLASREVLSPRRVLCADRVALPTFSVSFRHKAYLVLPQELRRHNPYDTPAYVVIDLVSPIAQTLRLVPTSGAFIWYAAGRKLVAGSGWGPWQPTETPVTMALQPGPNRLVGVHHRDHFADFSLAGYCDAPIEARNPFGAGGFQVVLPQDGAITAGDTLPDIDWEALRPTMPAMDPAHTMPWANAQDLALGATVLGPLATAAPGADVLDPLHLPPAADGEAARVVVDLGMVHNGWLAFEAVGKVGSRLVFSFFEGIDAGPPLRLHWAYGCQNALTYRLADGPQRFESFHPYGVRYIAIHHTGDNLVELSQLRVLTANCGSAAQGFLQSSDALLNQIYDMAVQSVISSVDDTYTDCPTFEQVNWNFDNRTAFLGEILTCANRAVARHSIALFAEDPEFTGLVRSQYPSTWDSFIPNWSLHWIMWVRDYATFTGDLAFTRQMLPRVQAGLADALGRIGGRGLLEWAGVWHFVEWCRGRDDDQAICGAEQAILVGALDAAIETATLLGGGDDDADAATAIASMTATWRSARAALVDTINRELWVPERDAYADSLHADGSLSPISSQVTNAMMGVYGVAPEARARALAARILDKDPALLAYGSPYGLYYVLELYDRFAMVEPIFAAIRHRWGEMVLAGDRTTWETFAEYGGHGGFPTRSRCHPFAAYVAKYLVKYLLGVQPLAAGFARCRVAPQPPAGVTQCHGAVPTPQGLLRVGWSGDPSAPGAVRTEAPPGVQIKE